MRQRIDQARHDLDLVMELDRIRLSRVTSGNVVSHLSRVTSGNVVFYRTKADRDYTKAFGDSGLAKVPDPPDLVAARIQTSTVRVALLAQSSTAAARVTKRSIWLVCWYSKSLSTRMAAARFG